MKGGKRQSISMFFLWINNFLIYNLHKYTSQFNNTKTRIFKELNSPIPFRLLKALYIQQLIKLYSYNPDLGSLQSLPDQPLPEWISIDVVVLINDGMVREFPGFLQSVESVGGLDLIHSVPGNHNRPPENPQNHCSMNMTPRLSC